MAGRYAVLPGVKRELDGIDPAMTRRITRQLKVLYLKYPAVAGHMAHIHTKNGVGVGTMNMRTGLPDDPEVWVDSMATCTVSMEMNKEGKDKLRWFAIGFNPLFFKNESQAAAMYQSQYYNPSGTNTPEGTVTHEFGHAVHMYLREMIPSFDEALIKLSLLEDSKSNSLCPHLSTAEMRMDAISPDPRCREYYVREVFAHAFSAIHVGTPGAQKHPVAEFVRKSMELYQRNL